MPKKFQGENSKAMTAKARKAEAKAVEDSRKKKELEDALWQENDKHVLKKEQRKDDKEKKRLEALERKKENQRLLDEEAAKIKGKAKEAAAVAACKVTRAQIEETLRIEQALQQQEQPKEKGNDLTIIPLSINQALFPLRVLLYFYVPPLLCSCPEKSQLESPLEENVNRIIPEEGAVDARSIEDAIAVLSTAEELDRHPERRVKAAFASYEELNMPLLKKENPNMRLSQLKQQLKKEWMKSPENPLNQRFANYNAK
ncbi:coiled-coil domain-containing protein 124 isoform 1-T1 [Salvelinus alpinus]|uniref:coiled-coil domain-containing protein 124 isoform X1 n=1 Tax=Salvelinus alpinus TaxID=8036 RepID=UPI0039FD5402